MYQQHTFGRQGETLARDYLQRHGYIILARNFGTRWGEIDIIARQADTIYFFEIKTRHSLRYGHPFEAVSRRKIRKIQGVALIYLERHPIAYHALAVGIIGIFRTSEQRWQIQVLERVI